MIQPREQIARMGAYALADLEVPAGKRLISLSQNESALPPSPLAIEAGRRAIADSALYPDPDWRALRDAIGDVHNLDAGMILCGAGSMELIGALIRAYTGPGTEVLASEHSYAFFQTAALSCGARYTKAPEIQRTVSVDDLLGAVTPATRIVCVANPGNPTGTRIGRSALLRLREGLRSDILLLIDEAYGEFAHALGETTFDLVTRGDTVVMRTLSKAYGLAGLRVGWGLFPTNIAIQVRKLLNPNNISGAAQAAATAAMKDQTYMRATVAETARRRGVFVADLRTHGFECADSHTNFVLVNLRNPDTAISASAALQKEGIILRAMGGYCLGNCLRATVGNPEDMAFAAEVLSRWKEQ